MNSAVHSNRTRSSNAHALVMVSLLFMIFGCTVVASADDTDVFFGSASSSIESRPNVMFVLDTSGSMGNRDGEGQSRLERMKEAARRMILSDLDMNIGLMN